MVCLAGGQGVTIGSDNAPGMNVPLLPLHQTIVVDTARQAGSSFFNATFHRKHVVDMPDRQFSVLVLDKLFESLLTPSILNSLMRPVANRILSDVDRVAMRVGILSIELSNFEVLGARIKSDRVGHAPPLVSSRISRPGSRQGCPPRTKLTFTESSIILELANLESTISAKWSSMNHMLGSDVEIHTAKGCLSIEVVPVIDAATGHLSVMTKGEPVVVLQDFKAVFSNSWSSGPFNYASFVASRLESLVVKLFERFLTAETYKLFEVLVTLLGRMAKDAGDGVLGEYFPEPDSALFDLEDLRWGLVDKQLRFSTDMKSDMLQQRE
jgi:hypothetical protein